MLPPLRWSYHTGNASRDTSVIPRRLSAALWEMLPAQVHGVRDKLWMDKEFIPARSTRCKREVRKDVMPSSTARDSRMQMKTQWDREELALVLVSPVWRLLMPMVSSCSASSPACHHQQKVTCWHMKHPNALSDIQHTDHMDT